MPLFYGWMPNPTPTWVTTTATTPANTIIWQTWTTPASTPNPIYFYAPNPAYDQAIRQQYQAMHQAQLQDQMRHQYEEAQARRDYAATEAARVIEPSREAAAARARDLLLQHLNEEQRRTFLANKWFVVEGGRSKRKYRVIDQGNTVANVHALDPAGNVAARLCAHGRMDLHLPLADHLLTQKIMLELDEDTFLRTANRH